MSKQSSARKASSSWVRRRRAVRTARSIAQFSYAETLVARLASRPPRLQRSRDSLYSAASAGGGRAVDSSINRAVAASMPRPSQISARAPTLRPGSDSSPHQPQYYWVLVAKPSSRSLLRCLGGRKGSELSAIPYCLARQAEEQNRASGRAPGLSRSLQARQFLSPARPVPLDTTPA